jgi:hypothetical protein
VTRRPVVAALAAIALHAVAALAQAPGSGLELRAAAGGNAQIDGGSVVTTVFTVKNLGSGDTRVQPAITVPRGWTVVMGSAGFSIAPGASDTWLVGVAVPATAVAGTYVVRGALLWNGTAVADSTTVRVSEHRAIEVLSLDVPGWVMAGSRYEARFLVRNRGNVPASINLAGSTSRGTSVETEPRAATLSPGAGTTVTVRVAMAQTFARTTDDVLELTAADQADAGVRVVASARTTVVPVDAGRGLATIPAVLSLRSIGGASGVAPIALAGGGTLQDNATLVDFFLQSPTGRQSPYGFGERDEYRANFRNSRFTLRLGDNPYGFSQLTSSGMMGTGAEFDGKLGAFSAGAYAQHLRWVPGSVSEAGIMLGTAPDSNRQLFSTFVERRSAGMPVSVGSLGGRLRLSSAASVQLEAATSDSARANGVAERARLYGSTGRMTYDLGMLHGGTEFAGMARGTTVEDGSFSARIGSQLTIGASGSIRLSDFATPLSGVPAQHYATANVSASYGGVGSLEYGWLSRHDDGALTPVDGTQRGIRATSSLPLGADASVSVSFERGAVNATMESSPRAYDVLSVSAQTRLWNAGTLSVFGAHNDGSTLTGATSGVANAGVSLNLHLPLRFELGLSTSAQRAVLGVFDGSGAWFSQSDARLDYQFAGGQTISLRERVWQNPQMQGSANARAIYLEFRTPVRLPIGPSRATGRAEGRIVDAATGQPLAGALVRVADQAAVTDRDGRVYFSGLAAARQRVSLDATGAAAGALLVGDAFIDVRDQQPRPATFALSVARGGNVRVLIRVMGPALGTLSPARDSLIAIGVEPNVLVALTSGRDTIYQSSDDRGRIDFGTVAPGAWTLVAMPGDLPDHHVFATDRMAVTVLPGLRNDVELRLVPKQRAITFIGNDVPLKAKPLP